MLPRPIPPRDTYEIVDPKDQLTMLFNEGDLVVIRNTYEEHLKYPLLKPFKVSDIFRVYSTYYNEDNHFFEHRQMTVEALVKAWPNDPQTGKWKDQGQSKWMLLPPDKFEELKGEILGKELGII